MCWHSTVRKLLIFGLATASWFSVLGTGAGSPPASAATNGQYSIFPATTTGGSPRQWFNYLVNPGSVITDAVTVTNQTPQTVPFHVYVADASNAVGGGFTIDPPQRRDFTVGKWTELSTLGFSLPPHTLANIPFTLKVPAGETPGDYAGGIVLSPNNPAVEQRGSLTFDIYQEVGSAHLPASTRSAASELVDHKAFARDVGLCWLCRWSGQFDCLVHPDQHRKPDLNPTAKLSVSPLLGSSYKIAPRIYSSLLPHNSVTVTYHLPSKEAFLRLTSNLMVTSGAGTTTATATAWVIPWILIAILVLLIGFIWYRRRRRRRAAGGAEAVESDLEPAAVATSSV